MRRGREPGQATPSCRYAFTNSASRVMVTSSPTRMPPVSRAAFQVKPKSFRLIFALAEIATRVLPHGSLVGGVGPSTSKADSANLNYPFGNLIRINADRFIYLIEELSQIEGR